MRHSKHSQHGHHSSHHADHSGKKPLLWGLHKDWRAWLVVGLMLAAISIYVLTLDESVQPEVSVTNPAPAAPASPNPQR
jgi:hypothetical protein